jgi:uncharacterized small protein (DUF1192 family)
LAISVDEDGKMDLDDDDTKPAVAIVVGADLANLSVAELEARIAALKAEIARIEQDLAGKLSSRSAADSVFKF